MYIFSHYLLHEWLLYIYINSRTKLDFEGKKLNKLLSSVIIILSKFIFPKATKIVVDACNPIIAYIMILNWY